MLTSSLNAFFRLLRLISRNRMMESFVSVDLETTGLDPMRCGITEIGWCAVHRGRIEFGGAILVRPRHDAIVDDHELTRHNVEKSKHAMFEFDEALMSVTELIERNFLGVMKPHLVMHNAPFDAAFIRANSAHANEFFEQFDRRIVDTQTIAVGMTLHNEMTSASLLNLCERLGVRPGNHTADEDARATAECMTKLIEDGWF